MMTSAQVVETSVNVTTNSPSQDYTHPDDHTLPTYDSSSLKLQITLLILTGGSSLILVKSIARTVNPVICLFHGAQQTPYKKCERLERSEAPLFVSARFFGK